MHWYEFCLGSESKSFMKDEQSEIFLKVLYMIFQLIIVKWILVSIYEYSVVKNNVNYFWGLLNKCLSAIN